MRLIDTALAVFATARLSRLVITDDLGRWHVHEPVDRAMDRYLQAEEQRVTREGGEMREPWWWRYRSGLDCPFCVGFWIGAGVLAAYPILPRPLWRAGTAALALNYTAAHLGARLGDYDTEEDQ